nr:class F sortase [Streptomyces sp. YIM 130001]
MAALSLAGALGGGLIACGPGLTDANESVDVPRTDRSTSPSQAGTSASGSVAPPMDRAKPVRVRIPAAHVDTGPVLDLGLRADGSVEVPSVEQADRIGWYEKGVTPGERGPAVLIGHFDTDRGPAVLRQATRLKAGNRVIVDRSDGSEAVFTVRRTEQVSKREFPTQAVYGDTSTSQLRVITCGGALIDGHRPDNIVVYADLTSSRTS